MAVGICHYAHCATNCGITSVNALPVVAIADTIPAQCINFYHILKLFTHLFLTEVSFKNYNVLWVDL